MTAGHGQGRKIVLYSLASAAGIAACEIFLLAVLYDLDVFSYPSTWWRDHPFDYENIRHTTLNFSLSTRLWAYDPLHLFGWVPNVFYNPLATALASFFTWPADSSAGAYRFWLLFVLLASSLVFLPLLPRRTSIAAWVAGSLSAAFLSLLVYPMDVGILDANPLQVLYTGQWAQRLGVALGVLCIERFFRALEVGDKDWRLSARRAITSAMLLGASLFCHFMSGYAAAALMVVLCLYDLISKRLLDGKFSLNGLILLPACLAACVLLYADFFWVFFSHNQTHHHLPLLGWRVADGALATVREVIVPALPLVLIPVVRLIFSAERNRPAFARALYPLAVYVLVLAATVTNTVFLLLILIGVSLYACRMERGGCELRHWLPVGAFFLLLLACGPGSLNIGGVDLSWPIPFAKSLGWAKLAAFSRFMFIAWLGILVVEGLRATQGGMRKLTRPVVAVLVFLGLGLPLVLSLDGGKRTGAQQFFDWMNHTDREATEALISRMRGVAARTPRNGFLLVEDTLHHAQGSALSRQAVPNGHLPYLIAGLAGRPVLGGSVTTRLTTHPFAHTSRGQLLCVDNGAAMKEMLPALDRLRSVGVSDILANSPELLTTLRRYPPAIEVDSKNGMTHFALEHYRPVLTDREGLHLAGAHLAWRSDGVELTLPPGTTAAKLRLVHYDFLGCEVLNTEAKVECSLSTWTEWSEIITGCLVNDDAPVEVEVPWIQVTIEPRADTAVRLRIHSRPAAAPALVMLLAWFSAVAGIVVLRRHGKKTPAVEDAG